MTSNTLLAKKINKYWRKQGLDPEARVEMTTATTVADEMVPVFVDGEIQRDSRGKLIKRWERDIRRTSTIHVVVSNMIDGFPTKRLPVPIAT